MQDGDKSDNSKKRAVKKMRDQIIKKHVDIIILKSLSIESLSGYGVITLVHREYDVLLGAGMVYHQLHSLEKGQLIRAKAVKGAKHYVLTKKGEEFLKVITENRAVLRNMSDNLF
jgi:DNA-binding PadR family transcriptional regulator